MAPRNAGKLNQHKNKYQTVFSGFDKQEARWSDTISIWTWN